MCACRYQSIKALLPFSCTYTKMRKHFSRKKNKPVHIHLLIVCVPFVLCVAVTPQDYQPPGFKETDSNTIVFEKEPVKLTMGEVVTPYHSLKLHMATERERLEQVGVRRTPSLTFISHSRKGVPFTRKKKSVVLIDIWIPF